MSQVVTTRLTALVSAVVLLFAGAATAVEAEDRVVGSMLMAAGFIILGAWVTLEVIAQHHRSEKDSSKEE
jgi:hypothetical protein